MKIFIDESGDFNTEDVNGVSVITAVVVPENKNYKLERFFAKLNERVSFNEKDANGEIKGYKLEPENLEFVFQFLSKNRDFRIVLNIFDHKMTSKSDIEEHRKGQAEKFQKGKEFYSAGPVKAKPVLDFLDEKKRWAERSDLISDVLYVQLALQVQVIEESLRKMVLHYHDESYRRLCFEEFSFIIDRKNKRIKKPEKYISELIYGFLENQRSKRAPYAVIDSLGKSGHPFTKFDRDVDGQIGTDLKKLLGDGLRFEDSKAHLGIQLADIIASGVRRIALGKADKDLFNLIRANAAFFEKKWQTISLTTFCLSGKKCPKERALLYKFLQKAPRKISF